MASKRELKDLKKGLKRIDEKCKASFNYLYNKVDEHHQKLEGLRTQNDMRKKDIAHLNSEIEKLKKNGCKCKTTKKESSKKKATK